MKLLRSWENTWGLLNMAKRIQLLVLFVWITWENVSLNHTSRVSLSKYVEKIKTAYKTYVNKHYNIKGYFVACNKKEHFHCNIRVSRFRWSIVSFTELKTTVIFSVSTAVVKCLKRGRLLLSWRLCSTNFWKIKFCTSCSSWGFP